jgi:hypothetical protein
VKSRVLTLADVIPSQPLKASNLEEPSAHREMRLENGHHAWNWYVNHLTDLGLSLECLIRGGVDRHHVQELTYWQKRYYIAVSDCSFPANRCSENQLRRMCDELYIEFGDNPAPRSTTEARKPHVMNARFYGQVILWTMQRLRFCDADVDAERRKLLAHADPEEMAVSYFYSADWPGHKREAHEHIVGRRTLSLPWNWYVPPLGNDGMHNLGEDYAYSKRLAAILRNDEEMGWS